MKRFSYVGLLLYIGILSTNKSKKFKEQEITMHKLQS